MRWTFVVVVLGLFALIAYLFHLRHELKLMKTEIESRDAKGLTLESSTVTEERKSK